MPRKHHLTSVSFFCASLGSAIGTPGTQKPLFVPLFTMRDLWHSQKWKGMLLDALRSLYSSHPTQPPWKLWTALWPLLQKKSIFSRLSRSHFLFQPPQGCSSFPSQLSNCRKLGTWSILLGKEEVRKWGELGDHSVKVPAVAQMFSWSSGQAHWSDWYVQQRKKINPVISSWSCFVSLGEVLTMTVSPQQAAG